MKEWKPRKTKRPRFVMEVNEINGKPVSETFLLDITADGAQLATTLFMVAGDLLRFCVSIPAEDTREKTKHFFDGRVMWVNKTYSNPEEQDRYRIGLSFSTFYRKTERIMENFQLKYFYF